MITSEERKVFKKLIGSKHCAKIQRYMEEKEITSQLKKPFGTPYISLVFNGNTENKVIEQAIWDFAEEKAKEIEEKNARLEKLAAATENPEPENNL